MPDKTAAKPTHIALDYASLHGESVMPRKAKGLRSMPEPLPLAVELSRELDALNLWHVAPEDSSADELKVQFTKTGPLEFVPLIDARVRPLAEALQELYDQAARLDTPHIPALDAAFEKAEAALKAATDAG